MYTKDSNRANTITIAELPKLKRAYNKAIKNGDKTFTVKLEKGNGIFLTTYAKYLIEYITNISSSHDNKNRQRKVVQPLTQRHTTTR